MSAERRDPDAPYVDVRVTGVPDELNATIVIVRRPVVAPGLNGPVRTGREVVRVALDSLKGTMLAGHKVRTANPSGRPRFAPSPAELLGAMRGEQARVHGRSMSDTEAARIVGLKCDPTVSGGHVMRLTRALRTA